jgi:K+-transporting ATPase ATPase C chain
MKSGLAELRTSCLAVLALAVILCGFYPLASWILAQGMFPARANGSLVVRDGVVMGSSLIGRDISGPEYFHPRPSEAGRGYDGDRSGGSNLGPLSKELVERVRRRAAAYRAENGLPADALVPADAVTASASGLDPHISLKNALLQAPRVARARGLTDAEILRQVEAFSKGRALGFLGEPRVNVLLLNLALDGDCHAE